MSQTSSSYPFSLSNKYYDLFYQHKDYKTEAEYVSRIIHHYNPWAKELLELGSGTGNYSVFLCSLGYEITGVELSTQMAEVSKSKSISGFTALQGDITSFELGKKFDAAVSLFHVINYLTENDKIIDCFKQVARHLNPKGIFIFDIWHTPAVSAEPPKPGVKRIENEQLKISRVAEPTVFYENIVNVHHEWTVHNKVNSSNEVFNEVHSMRHFDTNEIQLFAEASGFSFIKAEEFLTAKEPGNDTWGVCYILQKND